MYGRTKEYLAQELKNIREANLYKEERVILSDQKAKIKVAYPVDSEPKEVLNFCSNNYLGLANHPEIIEAAKAALDSHGFGLSSVRFICGTQDIHKQLEKKIASFYHQEDAILYSSCFDANGGLFETIMGADDVIITDQLNHASIIDGIRLSKAKRLIYDHADMKSLEQKLSAAKDEGAKNIMVATDGVFSMDGDVGNIRGIVELAKKFDALVMVDDSHATGFFGKTGRGAVEFNNALDDVDIVTSTLGKAMGGASGGFTASKKEIVEMLRQRSRPYLFSNTLAPAIVGASIAAFDLLDKSNDLREKLMENTKYFRKNMQELGFDVIDSVHPICPVLFRKFDNDAQLAQEMARELYKYGVYVIGFSFPVVPKGQARIRVQISAVHSRENLDQCINAFKEVGKKLNVI